MGLTVQEGVQIAGEMVKRMKAGLPEVSFPFGLEYNISNDLKYGLTVEDSLVLILQAANYNLEGNPLSDYPANGARPVDYLASLPPEAVVDVWYSGATASEKAQVVEAMK